MSVGPITPAAGGAPIGAVATGVGATAGSAPATQGGAPAAAAAPQNPAAAALLQLQSALGAVIGESIAAQDSQAVGLANLAAALPAAALTPAARGLIQQILTLQTPLDGAVTGDGLRAAVASSGLFLEATLASAVLTPGAVAPDLSGDLKALLLRLPAELTPETQLGALQAAPPPPRPPETPVRRSAARPAPPSRGGQTAGQPAVRSDLDPEADRPTLNHTLSQSAQAMSARLQLSQIASLPKPGEPAQWSFELPVAAPNGRAIAQFEIRRDPPGAGAAPDAEPTWRARFSLDVDPSGPVHAEVVLSGARTRVTLWAEDPAASAALGQGQAELAAALAGEEGGDAAVRVVTGAPAPHPAPAGQLINRTS